MGIIDVFLKPFLRLKGKVRVLSIETEVVDYYVVIYVKCENEEQAHELADAIDSVKDKILEVVQ